MKLPLKQLFVYFSLVTVGGMFGGSTVLFANSFVYPQGRRQFLELRQELRNVTVSSTPDTIVTPRVGGVIGAVGEEDVNFVAAAAQRTGPAVVRINATRKVANPISDAFKNPILRRFFGEKEQPVPQERI